jgi:hypothetical protein
VVPPITIDRLRWDRGAYPTAFVFYAGPASLGDRVVRGLSKLHSLVNEGWAVPSRGAQRSTAHQKLYELEGLGLKVEAIAALDEVAEAGPRQMIDKRTQALRRQHVHGS